MQKTLIGHFYNEEFLLPFWIKHHYGMFDHGVLINHSSTDNSVALIRELAPGWEIIDSKLKNFDPIMTDFEVQKIEEAIPGWKICLNISEFLVGNLEKVLKECGESGVEAISTTGVVMVDLYPDRPINNLDSLITQKPWGIIESRLYDLLARHGKAKKVVKYFIGYQFPFQHRSRLLHKKTIGAYLVGRHTWQQVDQKSSDLYTLWFGYSPWCREFIDRKLSFASKLPPGNNGLGMHHRFDEKLLNKIFNLHRVISKLFGSNFRPINDAATK
jgi:hypothetical protein